MFLQTQNLLIFRRKSTIQSALVILAVIISLPLRAQLPYPQNDTSKAKDLSHANSFDTDMRLDRKVTIDATAIPVEELLQRISDAQVTLSVGADTQGWKLQLHLHDRSLNMVMKALAEMLPGTWRPLVDGHSYRLEMTEVARRRRQRWWDLFESERAQALAAQRDAALRWMRASPDTRNSDADPNTVAANAYVARQQNFFNLLSPALQQQITDNLNDAPYYGLGNIQFGSDDLDSTTVVPFETLPTEARNMLARRVASARSGASGVQAQPGNAEDALSFLEGASVVFSNGGFALNAGVLFADGSSSDSAFNGGPGLVSQLAPSLLDQFQLAQIVAKMGTSAPLSWKELAKFQNSRFWPNSSSAYSEKKAGISRAAQLRYLSAQSGMEFIADYYSHGGHDMSEIEQKQPLKHSLTDELNNMVAWRDLSWKQTQDGFYLFRNNRWYRDDRLEVSAPLLRQWYTALRAIRSARPLGDSTVAVNPLKIQMDWEADIVSKLTRWQITNGLRLFMPEEENLATRARLNAESTVKQIPGRAQQINPAWYPPFFGTADDINHHYHTVLFYAQLDGTQREAFLAGNLRFASLSNKQQQEALRLAPALQRHVTRDDAMVICLRLEAIHPDTLPYVSKGIWVPTHLVVVRRLP